MAFKKLLASLGAGGASVETVLHEVNVVPGVWSRARCGSRAGP